MRRPEPEVLDLAVAVLAGRGVPAAHAALQAGLLVEAELKGHPSHGLQRLPRLARRIDRGVIDPSATGIATWRAPAFLSVDGQRGLGPVVAFAALERLIGRARETGVAVAAIRNANHLGMLAAYVERLAEAGLAGIALSTSEALVHPHGGTRALLGTNPVAIAVPTADRPLVLDLATGLVSMGKIHHHAAQGLPIPEGWARDGEGRPTTDAAAAKGGAIAPFGGAKGYGLGLAFELLVASLAGSALAPGIAGTLDDDAACNKGDVLIALDVGRAGVDPESLSAYLDEIRRSPPAEPGRPVAVPGDGAAARKAAARRDGIAVPPALWAELTALADFEIPRRKGQDA